MKHFNIRVYGIWINKENEILVCDERINDFMFTKFPGGGLEFGEGIKDCLIREWKEELDIDIEILHHIYTTDFFQISAFDQSSQIISIYYQVKPIHQNPQIEFKTKIFDFTMIGKEEINFRMIPVTKFTDQDVTLPIDKIVAALIGK
jgi:8-oxo-dGTP diphosphatase